MLIGFAGLGRMGRPMAEHLASAGHAVHAFDPMADTAPGSVRLVGNPVALADTEISISMLPDGVVTRALVTDSLRAAAPGHLHIVMGTVGPQVVHELAALPWIEVIDAPVSGSVAMAEAATITTMVGASPEQYERVRPLLAAMTAAQFHAGPAGAGSTAKLAVNTVLAGLSQAVAEGILLAQAAGLDPATFYGVLAASAAGAPYVGYKRQAYLAPDTTPVAAPVALIRKDLGLALELAHRHRLTLPGSEAAFAVLDDAVDAGLAEADMAEVLTTLRRSNALALSEILSPTSQTGALQ
ncbi:NAD(P)-dependent oxidoreductase [Nocardia gamkensis]|uniref:NAD(P)-dependent oxidoreductase n=1 Tax=Nocardia gamkensis TaxID=352869 RepID=UPI0037CBEBE3